LKETIEGSSRLDEALQKIRARLDKVSDTASLDAQVLLAHITGRPRSWVLAHLDEYMESSAAHKLTQALERLEQGEPLPYLIGEWEFFGLNFMVTPAVLIPRPETELLVESANGWLDQKNGNIRAVDVGTGSGCIAVALSVNNPNLQVFAMDISFDALQVAAQNIQRHAVKDRVFLVQSDLLSAVGAGLDLVCANLPYIPDETLKGLEVYRREPGLALDGGKEGLALISLFLEEASERLNPGGLVLVEIEVNQGKKAVEIARKYFPRASTSVIKDFSGLNRLLRIENR
jgi:release factor glutamine methyltransferase